MPSQFAELLFVGSIASSVTFNFLFPKCAVGLRHAEFRAMFMAVPEASMDEDTDAMSRKNDVRISRQIAAVKSEAISHRVQQTSDCELGLCVLSPNTRHQLASLLGAKKIQKRAAVEWRVPGESKVFLFL
jgi:hypothetical protein